MYAMRADGRRIGYMVNATHDLCLFDMAYMIVKERPPSGLDPIR